MSSPGSRPPLILVVAADADTKAFLTQSLGRKYRVASVLHSCNASQEARLLQPDLILGETRMTSVADEEFVKALRAHPQTAQIPVVLLAAKEDHGLGARLSRETVQACLRRPVTEGELLACVESLVAGSTLTPDACVRSEQLFWTLAEAAPVGMFRTNRLGTLLYANSLWRGLAGLPEAGGQGSGWWETVHPEDRERVLAAWQEAVARGKVFRQEHRFRTPDGSVTWVLTQAAPEKDDQGCAAGYVGAATDITGRKLAEARLARSQAELRAIYEHAPVLMCTLDERRQVLYANRAFCEFTGVPETELAQGRACGVFGCINAQQDPRGCGFGTSCVECALRQAIEDTFKTGAAHREVEYRATLERDGVRRDVVLLGATARVSAPGQVAVLLCLHDITERQASEAALFEGEERVRAILESVSESVFLIDANGVVLALNTTTARRLNRQPDEVLGRSVYDFLPPALAESRRRSMEAVRAAGLPAQFADTRGDRTFESTVYPVRDAHGRVSRFVVFARDITIQQQAEAERRRLYDQARDDVQARAELLDEVNHRVKNNLVSILGLIEMQKQDPALAASDPRSVLAPLQSRVEGMVEVHQMLTSAAWAPLPLGELVDRIVAGAVAASPLGSRLEVRRVFRPDACRGQQIVPRQASALALMLNELVTNGVKHAFAGRGAGRIVIDITVAPCDNGPAMLTLAYQDDGAGWPAEVLAGAREGIGLRLIRGTLRGLPQGSLALSNKGGALGRLSFLLTPVPPGAARTAPTAK